MPAENDAGSFIAVDANDRASWPSAIQANATPRLRFVKRRIYEGNSAGHPRHVRILQQEWHLVEWGATRPAKATHEWRDVPEVEDDNPPLSDVMADRRRQGLPDYPKPPLGQPPAFLQEQERSDGQRDPFNVRYDRMEKALQVIASDPGRHPANMVAIAKEGLEPC